MNVRRLAGALAAALLFTTACGGGGGGSSSPTSPTNNNGTGTDPYGNPTTPAAPAANQVIATASSAFNPLTITVTKGTDVTFTFESVTHNVAFDAVSGAPANVGNTTNASVIRTFATAGSFGFQCTLHGGMRGTVVVN